MSSPQQHHAKALKCLFRYLKGTQLYGLLYSPNNKPNGDIIFKICTGADPTEEKTRKSISENVHCIGSVTVSWSSRKQSVVALSTTEAKYISVTQGTQHTQWLRHLLQSFLYRVSIPTDQYIKNRSTMLTAKIKAPIKRRKHVDIRRHYLQYYIAARSIVLHRISTQKMKTGIVTEPLHRDAFEKLWDALKIQPLPTQTMSHISGDRQSAHSHLMYHILKSQPASQYKEDTKPRSKTTAEVKRPLESSSLTVNCTPWTDSMSQRSCREPCRLPYFDLSRAPSQLSEKLCVQNSV